MKNKFTVVLVSVLLITLNSIAQTIKVPSSCKVYLDDKIVAEVTIKDAIQWCELTPPMVKCDDGKIYLLENFQINFLTLNPFMNKDFGVGEGGFPILARNAIKNAKPGDTIILKNVTYTDGEGAKHELPTMSIKLKE